MQNPADSGFKADGSEKPIAAGTASVKIVVFLLVACTEAAPLFVLTYAGKPVEARSCIRPVAWFRKAKDQTPSPNIQGLGFKGLGYRPYKPN